MENEFILDLIPEFSKYAIKNPTYIESVCSQYKGYMERAEIPTGYMYQVLQNPFESWKAFKDKEVKEFVDDMTDYLNCEFNCVFNFLTYIDTDLLASYMIQRYLRNYFLGTKPIKNIIYIDTPLYMTDLKRKIQYSSDSDLTTKLQHRMDTVSGAVEWADFVIWDKMTDISTEYERGELCKILAARHKHGLGNLCFIVGGRKQAITTLSQQVADRMSGFSLVDIM